MNLDEILKYSVDECKKDSGEKYTHLFNVAAAISRFPELMDTIAITFKNNDQEIFDEYNKIKKDDNLFRARLIRTIMYAEKTDKNKLKQIIENYVTNPQFKNIVLCNSIQSKSPKDYMLACALLDDYYTYLTNGIWNGLSTKI